MQQFYNHKIFLLFIGGIISLALTITIICVKQLYKRELERKRLEDEKKIRPEEVGDIEAKLNDSPNFKKPNIFEEVVNWSIQPLLIISFLRLFDQSSEGQILATFFLVILTFIHEFYSGEKYSKKGPYQLFIFSLWLFLFFFFSHKANVPENDDKVKKQNSGVTHSNKQVTPLTL